MQFRNCLIYKKMIQFCLTPHKKSQQNVGSRKRRRSERNETGKERKKVEEAKKNSDDAVPQK